jgi:hypothetical protein
MSNKKEQSPAMLLKPQYETTLNALTDADRGKLVSAMMAYHLRGELPQKLSDRLMGKFEVFQTFIDQDAQSYKEVCEQNKAKAIARWENERRQRGE